MSEFIGGDKLQGLLLEAGKKVADKAIDKGLKAGVKIARSEIKRGAPRRTGNLRRSIISRRLRRRSSSTGEDFVLRYLVGTSRGGAVGHLIEFGTDERKTKRGAKRGRVKANPFFKPSYERKRQQIEQAITQGARDEANKILDALARDFNTLTKSQKKLL